MIILSKIQKWKKISSEYLVQNPYCRVRKDVVELPNGEYYDYYVNEYPNVVIILAITDDNEVVMVEQYRHGSGEILFELPGGIFNTQNETPEQVAKRELLEETGYEATDLVKVGEWYEYPAKDAHKIHAYYSFGVMKTQEPKPDPTEQIEVRLVKLNKVLHMIQSGQLKVTGTILIILLTLDKLQLT
jgi:ADP-ribose pyrophosphatase YjhB (NUDIX family)